MKTPLVPGNVFRHLYRCISMVSRALATSSCDLSNIFSREVEQFRVFFKNNRRACRQWLLFLVRFFQRSECLLMTAYLSTTLRHLRASSAAFVRVTLPHSRHSSWKQAHNA